MQRIKAILFGFIALAAVITLAACALDGGGGSGGTSSGNGNGGNGGNGGGGNGGDSGGADSPFIQDLASLAAKAVEGGEYTITLAGDEAVTRNETAESRTFFYGGKNVRIILEGGTAERTVSVSFADDPLFTVGSGVTLVLGNNLTLTGNNDDLNFAPLVKVESGGSLEMKTGSKISGNTREGVSVAGTFTMNGGTISGNTSRGVHVDGGTFTMNSGAISGNTANGVHVDGGTFTMNGGTISGNTGVYSGGGVYVDAGSTFTMNGGTISGNTASDTGGGGGGVYVPAGSTFTMSGGTISGNTTASGGGGVCVDGTFTMSGGTISGNTVTYGGGGVRVETGGTFTMSGGTISGNTTTISDNYCYGGGGVFVFGDGTFTKSGGIIYGSEAADVLKNTAASNNGHAVYVSEYKKRDNTAEQEVKLYAKRVDGAWTYNDTSEGGVGDTTGNWVNR